MGVGLASRLISWSLLSVHRLQWLSMANGELRWVVGNAVVPGRSPHTQRATSGRGGAGEWVGMSDLSVLLPLIRLPLLDGKWVVVRGGDSC